MSDTSKKMEMDFSIVNLSLAPSLVQLAVSALAKTSGFAIAERFLVPKSEEQGIPLLLCDNREALKQNGIMPPYEFTIERCDLVPILDEKGRMVDNPLKTLSRRLRTLEQLYRGKDFKETLQDWFAGMFRMYLMLDATTHGTSEFIDLERVKAGTEPILMALAGIPRGEIERRCFDALPTDERATKVDTAIDNAEKFRKRLNEKEIRGEDSFLEFKLLARHLFFDYFIPWGTDPVSKPNVKRSIVRALALEKPEDRFDALCGIYCDVEKKARVVDEKEDGVICIEEDKYLRIEPRGHGNRIPLAFGERAKHVTPSGKLNLLLIDDNVGGSPLGQLAMDANVPGNFASSISQDDWSLLRDVFNVQPMPVREKEGNIFKCAVKRCQKMQEKGLTFDLILVDLCLGNNARGTDLAGYRMIRIVKDYFPGTPIVVYSRFSDMEHIARAFFSGAKWFLVKGEEAKLPRHVLKLLKQVGWHREWRAIENGANSPIWHGDEASSFYRKFNRLREWKYLTYKCLEHLPGRDITVRKMGGGISSAVTFKATKGIWLEKVPLQTPCIIKIDTFYNTMMEFERYNRMIRPYIANEAGRVEMPERVLNRQYSSIVYTFAGKQDNAHELASMGDMLDDDVGCQTACDYETYRHALKCIFDEILPKIHHVSPELEYGDIGEFEVQQSKVRDAFSMKEKRSELEPPRNSFPNFYFSEFEPTEFWKSYMLRMQPWGRISIGDVVEDGGTKRLFMLQETLDLAQAELKPQQKRLIFHNVLTDPFADKDGEKAGQRIIEAYTEDRKLVWLEGDVCDFVARFRKRVAPGTSLWLKKLVGGAPDNRLQWLKSTFKRKKEEYPDVQDAFVESIASLVGKGSLDNEELGFYTILQDELLDIAREVPDKAKEWGMKCPVGIVHGDLNVKNIMLESRKHPPKEGNPDVTQTVSDVWLIDFARTRRDLIAHDFNVFFTSVLGELFHERLIGKDGNEDEGQKAYWNGLTAHFRGIVSSAVVPQAKSARGIPDPIKDDRRFTLIYRILRRTHDAAFDAGVSQNMYLLTTALACLYTLKIFLNNGCKVRLAAGYFAAAWICYDLLCEKLGRKNQMENLKKMAES